MNGYSMMQWLFFFYLYCFIGWCFESVYVSCRERKPINRGFMRGPFLPIYGSGAIVMLILSEPFQSNLILTYIAGVIGATALEYVTGVCMEALFKVRYWDYSNQKWNYHGYICLSSSIAWGFLTILMTRVIHKPIEHFVLQIPTSILSLCTVILTIILVADFATAFRTAMDLRDVLIRMEKGKEELLRMQKRLDVMIAVMESTKEEITEELQQRKAQFHVSMQERDIKTEEVIKGIEERLAKMKHAIYAKPTKYLESVRDEVAELRGRFTLQAENRYSKIVKDIPKRKLILANPSMCSTKYHEVLEELKKVIADLPKKDKNKENKEKSV